MASSAAREVPLQQLFQSSVSSQADDTRCNTEIGLADSRYGPLMPHLLTGAQGWDEVQAQQHANTIIHCPRCGSGVRARWLVQMTICSFTSLNTAQYTKHCSSNLISSLQQHIRRILWHRRSQTAFWPPCNDRQTNVDHVSSEKRVPGRATSDAIVFW